MSCLAVIPARFQSSRLPGKPLKDIAGKILIQRVWEQAKKAKLISRLVIATDDERIFTAARNFGANVMLTSSTHHTGSDRVAEVMESLSQKGEEFSLIANIQGDMPFINPEAIDATIAMLQNTGEDIGMSTLASPILSREEFLRPSVVKVVLNNSQQALYFSRAPIPFSREEISREENHLTISEESPWGYKHYGLYVFRPWALRMLSSLPQPLVEQREKLEQLRALSGGIKITVACLSASQLQPSIEVDTEEDLERARVVARSL